MKYLIYIFMLLILNKMLYSQQTCATVLPEGYIPPISKDVRNYYFDKSVIYNIPLKIHIVYYSHPPLETSEIDNAIQMLVNPSFSQTVLQFYRKGDIDYIIDEEYEYINNVEESHMLRHENNDPYAIDIYFVPNMWMTIRGVSSYPPPYTTESQGIVIEYGYTNSPTFPHEIAHYFFLLHTYEGANGENEDCIYDIEECIYRGDEVCDTNVDPSLDYEFKYKNYAFHFVEDFQIIVDDITDLYDGCDEQYYEGYTFDGANLMTKARDPETIPLPVFPNDVRFRFTEGQIIRMNQMFFQYRLDELVRKDVTFINSVGMTNLGGDFTINDELILSGEQINLGMGENVNSKTNSEIFEDVEINEIISDVKHHDWQSIPHEYKVEYNFELNEEIPDVIRANFSILSPATIRTDLYGCSGGEIRFRDPWYVDGTGSQPDEFQTYNSPFNPGPSNSDYKGIFLDQEPDPANPEVPYYSIEAPEEQDMTINGKTLTAYFQHWSGNSEQVDFEDTESVQTAVVFKENGATANAVYKGHLAAAAPTATFGNNGAKMSEYYFGDLQLVYEDQGCIWQCRQNDSGVWGKDKLVAEADASDTHKTPATAFLR